MDDLELELELVEIDQKEKDRLKELEDKFLKINRSLDLIFIKIIRKHKSGTRRPN